VSFLANRTGTGPKTSPAKSRGAAVSRQFQKRSASQNPAHTRLNGRRTLSERLYQALKRDIIRGLHPAGEALGEKVLAKRYKSSRTPVREAAVRLEQENLLRIVPNRGYFASSMTMGWINEIYEFRASVEGACAELAARKGCDEKLLEELYELGRSQWGTHDRATYEKFIQADTTFHIGLARLTRNALMVRTVSDLRCHMERIMYAAIGIGYYGEAPAREHVDILNAVRSRDSDLSRRLMHEHILQSRAHVLRLATGDPLS
jgi:DNA-binding GntR family transcriptional regulator